MLELTLTHADGSISAAIAGEPLTGPTPADTLPRITRDENPYRYDPIGLGQRLYAALGGQRNGQCDHRPHSNEHANPH